MESDNTELKNTEWGDDAPSGRAFGAKKRAGKRLPQATRDTQEILVLSIGEAALR